MKNERVSSLELLRIICMLGIIAHHCVIHGETYLSTNINNKMISYFIAPAGKIGFVAFIALSMYFLVDAKFSFEKFFKIWFQTFFYSVAITVITLIFFKGGVVEDIGLKNIVTTALPILGNSHGFAAIYMAFYLLLPFIQFLGNKLNKIQARYLVILLFFIQIVVQFITSTRDTYSQLLFFILCYFVMLNLKKYPINIKINNLFLLSSMIFCWILYTMQYYIGYEKYKFVLKFIVVGESNPLCIIAGFCLFYLFRNIKIKQSNGINRIASTTFGILLIHDHNVFRPYLWQNIINTKKWSSSSYFLLYVMLSTILIFLICMMIDLARKYILEKKLFDNRYIKTQIKRIETYINFNNLK